MIPVPENPNGKLSENAIRVIKKRYLHDGESTWHDVALRMARHVAAAEPEVTRDEWTRIFYDVIFGQEFIPNSPTIRNAGIEGGQLSACFVIGPEGFRPDDPDSTEAIMDLIKGAVYITRSGGGVGVHYGAFRPRRSYVRGSTHKAACGPVSVMRMVCGATKEFTQAGFREAAMMSILPVDHPDVIEFIYSKSREGAIHNTNISVAVTNDFMLQVEAGGWFELRFPGWTPSLEHFRVNGEYYPGFTESDFSIEKGRMFVRARALFDAIANNAWKNGEPGLFFIDTENATNPWHHVGVTIRGTNPCGEQPLPDFGTCNLGHIALGRCVYENDEGEVEIDWSRMSYLTRVGVRFLDDVITTNTYPLPQITETAEKYRNIGLGVVGFADMLLKLGIPYGSEEALELEDAISGNIYGWASHESAVLAMEKGADTDVLAAVGRRNLVLTTVAPTGTTAQIVDQFGGGIEPMYAPTTWRYDHVHPEGYEFVIPNSDQPYFRSALNKEHPERQITVMQHVLAQAAWQKNVDSAISKTINMPNSATVKDVQEVYMVAWKTGCKGITVYRDGSRSVEVLTTEKKKVAFDPTLANAEAGERPDVKVPKRGKNKGQRLAPERPKTLPAVVRKQIAGEDGAKVYVTVSTWDDRPYEVFVNPATSVAEPKLMQTLFDTLIERGVPVGFVQEQVYKANGKAGSEKLTRFVSMWLRHGFDVAELVAILQRHARSMYDIPSVLASVLQEAAPSESDTSCPSCGNDTVFMEGCLRCLTCEWSKCG